LRSQDWVPRSIRDKSKRIEKTYAELEQRFGRAVSDEELSAALGITLEEYYETIAKVKAVTLLSIDELSGPNNHDRKSLLECLENVGSKNPFLQLKSKGVRDLLINNIEDLPEKQKLVLSLYYYEDLNLKEIGRVLDVTESRVSQLHTQAVSKLRQKLKPLLQE